MFLKIITLFIGSYACKTHPPHEKNYLEYEARVTYYWEHDQTSTGKKPICGYTVAVDPKIIPYHTKIYIPKLKQKFIAQDTGPDVVNKKAAKRLGRKDAIVIDVYCATKAIAMKRIKKNPMFMKIRIPKKS